MTIEQIKKLSTQGEAQHHKQDTSNLNSPSFAHLAVYGEVKQLSGRTGHESKMWHGLDVDAELKDKWLDDLKSIEGIEIRATCQGHDKDRVAYVVFRLIDGTQEDVDRVTVALSKKNGIYALSGSGREGLSRTVCAGKTWHGSDGWEAWWNAVADNIREAVKPAAVSKSVQDVLDKLKDLPPHTWIHQFISLTGSMVYGTERTPNDLDIVVKAQKGEKGDYWVKLDPELRLKIDRILKERLGVESSDWLNNPSGPNWQYVPLFNLSLVPVAPELQSVGEPEFAEEFYKGNIEKGIRQLFGSPGGKSRVAKLICSYFPDHETYLELFAGGAAVFFAKNPSDVEILNDKDPEIAFAYRYAKKLTEKDLSILKGFNWKLSRNLFDKMKEFVPKNEAERFYKFVVLIWGSYNSDGKNISTMHEGETWAGLDRIERIRDRIKNVTIYSKSAQDVLKEFNRSDSFAYLDPPFPGEWQGRSPKYSNIDLPELKNILKKWKGKFILSLNDIKEWRDLFKGFHIKKIEVPRTMGVKDEPTFRVMDTELLISNFPLKKSDTWIAKSQVPDGLSDDSNGSDDPTSTTKHRKENDETTKKGLTNGNSKANKKMMGKQEIKKQIEFISKNAAKQIVYGVVYEPDVEDADGDWASAEDIEKACHKFMAYYQNISLMHKMLVNDRVKIVENYIAPVDFELGDETVIKGSWVQGLQCDDEVWKKIESGEITGLSLGGYVMRDE